VAAGDCTVEYVEFETRRGERAAEAIVAAALRCLARDGYAATSIQDIAHEAGTSKRMVHYYFETREQLFAVVAQRVGDQLLDNVREAVSGLDDPEEIISVGVDRWWEHVTGNADAEIVYFGLLAESFTDPVLKEALASVNDGLRSMLRWRIRESTGRKHAERGDEETAIVLTVALIQGLKLHYLERGDSPQLQDALNVFKQWLVRVLEGTARLSVEPRSSAHS